MTTDLWVLATAPGSRTQEAVELFDSLGTPENRRVLVTNPPDIVDRTFPGIVLVHNDPSLNISNWWNEGLDYIEHQNHLAGNDAWDVLLAETDARMDPQQVEQLRSKMREFGAVMAGGDWENTLPHDLDWHFRTDNRYDPVGRIPGIMKVVAGETGIRHDPEFRWWLADDDYEWQHRVNGGTLLVRGIDVRHTGTQGPLTGDRLRFWEEDQVKFFDKWGGMPATNGILP